MASDCTSDHKNSPEDPNDKATKWKYTESVDMTSTSTNKKVTDNTHNEGS